MTIPFIEDTANTAPITTGTSNAVDGASTAPQFALSVLSKGGVFMAGVVLSAALSVSGAGGAGAITGALGSRRRFGTELSSTGLIETDQALCDAVKELFEEASSEFFEDGVHSRFSRNLLALLSNDAPGVVRAIARYLFSGQADSEVTSESLRWLSEFRDPSTLSQRWAILARSLKDKSPTVRDGAILGFANLDDARAAPVLLEAKNKEPIAELRRLIDQVTLQLGPDANGHSASHGKGKSLV